jgi:demethylmenaquinone methyltransferase/2-methoxy-6-polyprenyl-1,4-benzoquinol methylase
MRMTPEGRTSMEQAEAQVPPHPPLLNYYESDADRQRFLNALFNRTAVHYRSLDHATGFGSGRWYRRKALREAGLAPGMKVLDVACGPGLVAQCAAEIVGPTGSVVGLDPSTGMLREATKGGCPALVQAVGEYLPFPNASFDFVSMGYALRHVTDLGLAFREYARVLKPGGVALVLEISRPRSAVLRCLLRFYVKTVLRIAFVAMTGNRDMHTLMRYWWDTMEHCVPPETVLAVLKDSGFARSVLKERSSGLLRDYEAVKA